MNKMDWTKFNIWCKNDRQYFPSPLYLTGGHMLTLTSSRKKPSGICSICRSKSKSFGSCGRNFWRVRLAVLCRLAMRGRQGQGASVSSLSSTSLTTSDAGLKTSCLASCLTRHLIFAATIPPTGAAWLWWFLPNSNTLPGLCTTVALQRFPY